MLPAFFPEFSALFRSRFKSLSASFPHPAGEAFPPLRNAEKIPYKSMRFPCF
jgi:hypothetical protein